MWGIQWNILPTQHGIFWDTVAEVWVTTMIMLATPVATLDAYWCFNICDRMQYVWAHHDFLLHGFIKKRKKQEPKTIIYDTVICLCLSNYDRNLSFTKQLYRRYIHTVSDGFIEIESFFSWISVTFVSFK